MGDYIEREAAIEAVTVWYKKTCRPENMSSYNMGERAAYTTAICEITELPAADVRPVVRGHWHGEGDGYADGELVCDMWQCSCCGEWFDEWDDKPTWNFCPNCGADMRTGAE